MRLLVAPGRRALAHASRSLGAVAAAASSDPTLADLVARTRAASRGPASSTSSSLCVHGSDTAAEAVRFEPHAPPRVVTTTTAALGLPPRDAAVLRPPSASGGGQRATLVAREVGAGSAIDGDALILVRTEAVRAAVGARAAHVFPCRRPADTAALLAAVDAAAAAAAAPFGPPFELAVLEALLSESVRHFERRTRQLRVLADGVASDVGRALRWAGGAAASTGELGRLLPVQRALTEVLHDVREARGAVESVTASPRALEGLCLTDREKRGRREAGGGDAPAAAVAGAVPAAAAAPPPSLRAAEALFESYERQLQSVEGALLEMEDNMMASRDAWSMALDAHRNRTLRISLHVSLATAAVAVACGAPAAFLGMNVDIPPAFAGAGAFWPVVAGCTGIAVAGYGGLVSLWQVLPTWAHRRRVADARALRDLLVHHLDDLDVILAAVRSATTTSAGGAANGGRLSRDAFAKCVAAATGGAVGTPLRPDEIDALFRVYDVNESGFLELGEVVAARGGGGGEGGGGWWSNGK